ncbi:MAG: DUF1207 domain-containing protein [bacterium]
MKAPAKARRRPPRLPVAAALFLAAMLPLAPGLMAGPQVWYDDTRRVMPPLLAATKDTGVVSAWGTTDNGETVWDFDVGSDIPLWQTGTSNAFLDVGARFIVSSRFQFNSESFNLWGSDFCGGLVFGRKWASGFAVELFGYHESSHLGDEMLDLESRQRLDCNVNGVRVLCHGQWPGTLSTYGGFSYQGPSQPDAIAGFGVQLGVQATGLPPFKRGFVAVDAQSWDWRDWSPDVCARMGFTFGVGGNLESRHVSLFFVQAYSGRVDLWQYWDETETTFSAGLAHHW